MERPTSPVLAGLLIEHRRLESCVRTMDASPVEVLAAGQTLLAFAANEDRALASLLRLLDQEVIDELHAEHAELGRDLELLQWLLATTPDSPDAAVLAQSLARRMHQHVSRDGRLLARAAHLEH
jgi:hypothetical protein